MPDPEYFEYNGKKYKIRNKTICGANGKKYEKYVLSVPVGIKAPENKLQYKDYTGNTPQEAVDKVMYDIGSGYLKRKIAPSDITVENLARQWLEIISPSLRETTRRGYGYMLERILPNIGKLKVTDSFDYRHCQDYINKLIAKGYAPTTIMSVKRIISQIADYGIDMGLLVINPANHLAVPKNVITEKTILSKSQMLELLRVAPEYEAGNFIAIAMLGALRLGECRGLPEDGVNLEKLQLNIRQQYIKDKIYNYTKTGVPRTIQLPKMAESFIESENRKREKYKEQYGEEWNNEYGLFFVDSSGRPMIYEHIFRDFADIQQRIGIGHMRFHDLRHTAASAIVNESGNIYEAQRYLGHVRSTTTMLYVHSTEESRMEVANTIDNYFKGITDRPPMPV